MTLYDARRRGTLRPTLRLRLALLAGGLLLVGGAFLVLLAWLIVGSAIGGDDEHGAGSRIVQPDGSEIDAAKWEQDRARHAERETLVFGATALIATTGFGVAGGYVLAGRALRPLHRVTDVAPEARGGVPVAAQPHVVGPQVVIGLEAAAPERRHRFGAIAVGGHPEDVQVADLVIGSARRHGRGFELDGDRPRQAVLEPQGQSGRGIDVQHAVTGHHRRGLFRFEHPVFGVGEIVGVQKLGPRGVHGAAAGGGE